MGQNMLEINQIHQDGSRNICSKHTVLDNGAGLT